MMLSNKLVFPIPVVPAINICDVSFKSINFIFSPSFNPKTISDVAFIYFSDPIISLISSSFSNSSLLGTL